MQQLVPLRGRGTQHNPANRFQPRETLFDLAALAEEEERPNPATQLLRDHTRGILATNDSPDVPFDVSLNPYRGCEHGCTGREARSWIETQRSHRSLFGKQLHRTAVPPDGGLQSRGAKYPLVRWRNVVRQRG